MHRLRRLRRDLSREGHQPALKHAVELEDTREAQVPFFDEVKPQGVPVVP